MQKSMRKWIVPIISMLILVPAIYPMVTAEEIDVKEEFDLEVNIMIDIVIMLLGGVAILVGFGLGPAGALIGGIIGIPLMFIGLICGLIHGGLLKQGGGQTA